MSERSLTSPTSSLSSLPDRPQISNKENQLLPRRERIYNHLLWPRHFQIMDTDAAYLDRMKLTYNILMTAPTDLEARAMIRELITDVRLSTSEVIELIWDTKDLFGRIDIRNVEFDRAVVRAQLLDLVRRAKVTGDIKNERLAWKQIIDLDKLSVEQHESRDPVVPPLPDVEFTNRLEADDAIVESLPASFDEEE